MIGSAAGPAVHHLATHPLVLALPAVIPAFLVVGVIVTIAIIDRRRGDEDDTDSNTDDAPDDTAADRATHPDPTAPPTRNEADDPAREAD
ncbi:hypothetical protein [Gordonia sp. HS-NH1]|uniref:hypothetical protein n=1 Tax=Gordonia sp. HS-NH1 TaxID=1435068 RepID=UPI0006E3F8E4|nr:hypothetical protein [Gordonia sp. HS-NH1]